MYARIITLIIGLLITNNKLYQSLTINQSKNNGIIGSDDSDEIDRPMIITNTTGEIITNSMTADNPVEHHTPDVTQPEHKPEVAVTNGSSPKSLPIQDGPLQDEPIQDGPRHDDTDIPQMKDEPIFHQQIPQDHEVSAAAAAAAAHDDSTCPIDPSECRDNIEGGLQVTANTFEGLTIPAGINLTIRCTVTIDADLIEAILVKWNTQSGAVVDVHAQEITNEFKLQSKIHVTNEIYDQSSKGVMTIISTMQVFNLTSDLDSGRYTCSAIADSYPICCRQTAAVDVTVYVPPTYANDLAIIGAICFLEFVIILYCKTKNLRKGRKSEEQDCLPRTQRQLCPSSIESGDGCHYEPLKTSDKDQYAKK